MSARQTALTPLVQLLELQAQALLEDHSGGDGGKDGEDRS